MVQRFNVAVINRGSLESEALKRFSDRGYSKTTLQNYIPNIAKAKFIERKKGFSIYEVPLKKVSKQIQLKKGDKVKIIMPFSGFKDYGLRKGSVGKIIKPVKFRNQLAYQIYFPTTRKELTLYSYEIRKVK